MSKIYSIKEIFYTLQGEGMHSGRPAIFVRFAGCNLWTGLEQHRASAICKFCDTDFVGTDGDWGGKHSIDDITEIIKALWPDENIPPFIVCTGGEPGLQMDDEFVNGLHQIGCIIAIESNGTVELPQGIDWICISPKSNTELLITSGDELKLIYPQSDALPERFVHLNFKHFSLQPMDCPKLKYYTQLSLAYCKEHPKWSLSLQTHKLLDIP